MNSFGIAKKIEGGDNPRINYINLTVDIILVFRLLKDRVVFR